MSDAQPVTGETTGDNQAQVIAQAVAAAVTASLQEITNKLNSIEQNIESRVKQTSANDDTNFETSVTGVYDPFDDLRRANMSRDRVSVYAEQALANALKVADGLAMRSLDHFCATNPEINPRVKT